MLKNKILSLGLFLTIVSAKAAPPKEKENVENKYTFMDKRNTTSGLFHRTSKPEFIFTGNVQILVSLKKSDWLKKS